MKKESRLLLWVQTVQKLKTRKPQRANTSLCSQPPKALFGSHRSTIPKLNKIEAVFIDEVCCVAKECSIHFIFTLLESYQLYTTFRSAAFLLSKVRFCCLPRLSH